MEYYHVSSKEREEIRNFFEDPKILKKIQKIITMAKNATASTS